MSSFLAPAMKRLLKPTQKLKPGLLPKNIIPKNKWSVSVLCCALLRAVLGWFCAVLGFGWCCAVPGWASAVLCWVSAVPC